MEGTHWGRKAYDNNMYYLVFSGCGVENQIDQQLVNLNPQRKTVLLQSSILGPKPYTAL